MSPPLLSATSLIFFLLTKASEARMSYRYRRKFGIFSKRVNAYMHNPTFLVIPKTSLKYTYPSPRGSNRNFFFKLCKKYLPIFIRTNQLILCFSYGIGEVGVRVVSTISFFNNIFNVNEIIM